MGSTKAVVQLSTRLIRRSSVAIGIGIGALVILEAMAFKSSYPDAASRAALSMWGKDPGIRMISGRPTAVETLGGFIIWDASLYFTLILGAWALTMCSRILRGDEGAGRTEVLLAGPIRPARALLIQLLVLLGACVAIGFVIALSLTLSGAQALGAMLFGVMTAGYCGTLVGITGLASQIFASRVGALSAAGSILTASILLRMLSNSSDSRAWIGWMTPTGWTDHLRPFGENRWPVLLVPLLVIAALVGAALVLRKHRDTGAGLISESDTHRSRSWGLGSPLTFAWRINLGVLFIWCAGVATAGAIVGALLPTFEQYLATDKGFQDLLSTLGMNTTDLTRGFIGMWATILGLVIAVYVAFRLGSTRSEEASTRVEFLLTRPVRRWRWLGGHALCAVLSVLVLCTTGASAMWLAGLAASAPLTAEDAFAAMFNMVPVVMVFLGLCILVYAIAPRLTVPVGAAAAVVTYILEMVGPLLHWPNWLMGLSPFHHLEAVPVDPFGLSAAITMVMIGSALALVGMVAFDRRDLVGA